MKNKTVKLVLGIVLLGVLTGGYFGVKSYVASQEESEVEQEEEKTNVFEMDTTEIASLKFLIDKKEVTFVKDEENWIKEDEKDFPVDQDVMNNAASYISSIDAERVLEDVEDLGEYELDNPENTITISSDDEESTVIRVGMKNESTNQYYVSKNDDRNTVYVVSASAITPFMNTLYDYAEMQNFPDVNTSTVSKVSVDQEDKGYEVVKDENTGFWQVESDDSIEKGDSAKLSSLVTSLGSLEYDSFVDYNCIDESQYGFDDPYAVVTVEYEEEVEVDEEEAAGEVDADATDIEADADAADMDTESDVEDSESDIEGDTDESTLNEDSIIVDEESDASEEENEPVMEEKKLIFMVGNETDDDSRYVMVEGSKEVYTMTNDLLSTVIDKDVSTMWDMSVMNYTPLSELDSLSVELDGEKKVINVSRETLEEEDESEETSEDSLSDNESEDDSEAALSDDESEDDSEAALSDDESENDSEAALSDDESENDSEVTLAEDDPEEVSEESLTDSDSEDSSEESLLDDDSEDSLETSLEDNESTEEESEPEIVVTYEVDGEVLDDMKLSTFYNKLLNLVGQKRLTEEYDPEDEPEMSVVFHNLENESVNVDFYEYDVNYYAAVVDKKVYLFNKMTFKELRESYEALFSESAE